MLKSLLRFSQILLGLFLVLSFFVQDSSALDTSKIFAASHFSAPFGYDHYGRNILLFSLSGLRQSMLIAVLAVLLGASLGTLVSVLSTRYYRGILDQSLSRINNLIFAFPALITALLLTSFAQSAGLDWLNALRSTGMLAMIAIALFNVPVFAQITRARAAWLWQRPFVQVAHFAGHSHLYCAFRHVLPNILAPVLVHCATQVAMALIAEASLSFLGLGVTPPLASLGRQIAEARTYIAVAPQLVLIPALLLVFATLVLVLSADRMAQNLDDKTERLL